MAGNNKKSRKSKKCETQEPVAATQQQTPSETISAATQVVETPVQEVPATETPSQEQEIIAPAEETAQTCEIPQEYKGVLGHDENGYFVEFAGCDGLKNYTIEKTYLHNVKYPRSVARFAQGLAIMIRMKEAGSDSNLYPSHPIGIATIEKKVDEIFFPKAREALGRDLTDAERQQLAVLPRMQEYLGKWKPRDHAKRPGNQDVSGNDVAAVAREFIRALTGDASATVSITGSRRVKKEEAEAAEAAERALAYKQGCYKKACEYAKGFIGKPVSNADITQFLAIANGYDKELCEKFEADYLALAEKYPVFASRIKDWANLVVPSEPTHYKSLDELCEEEDAAISFAAQLMKAGLAPAKE